MKKTIALFALPICFFACDTKLTEKDVPAAVKETFKQQFTGAKEAEWEEEEGKFEVSFEQDDKEVSAVFTAEGVLEETEVEIKKEELPAAVLSYLSANYNGKKIEEAAKITKASGEINYEAEINEKDLMFDASGKLIMAKEEKDDKN